MALFADFELLNAPPGVQDRAVRCARRVASRGGLQMRGPSIVPPPNVDAAEQHAENESAALWHVARYRDEPATRTHILALARALQEKPWPIIGAPVEIGVCGDSLYCVAPAADGPSLRTLADAANAAGQPFPLLPLLASVSEIVRAIVEARERDVWAEHSARSLAELFVGGVQPHHVIITRGGRVTLRLIDGIARAADPESLFRAPELAAGAKSATADTFNVGQLLRACLSGDTLGRKVPHLQGHARQLAPLLARCVLRDPDERPDVDALAARLDEIFEDLAEGERAADVLAAVYAEDPNGGRAGNGAPALATQVHRPAPITIEARPDVTILYAARVDRAPVALDDPAAALADRTTRARLAAGAEVERVFTEQRPLIFSIESMPSLPSETPEGTSSDESGVRGNRAATVHERKPAFASTNDSLSFEMSIELASADAGPPLSPPPGAPAFAPEDVDGALTIQMPVSSPDAERTAAEPLTGDGTIPEGPPTPRR